jgi:propanol-preferring alcohol dehydrogenase
MFAIQLFQPSKIEKSPLKLSELPKPRPKIGQVRVQVLACGVCHTDLHIVEGDIHPPKMPIIPGHQVVGIVDSLGPHVDSVKVGDRVGIPWLYKACGKCEFCRRGEENLCPQGQFTGFHHDGGFCEFMVAEACYVLPLPDGLSDEQAAPLLCAGIIGYRSLNKADLRPGERLGLIGFGASAHLAIQVARYWGCEVYAFTRSKDHRQHAEKLGAAWTGGIGEKPPHFLDRAIIFAPVGDLVPAVLERLRPGGTLAINAIHMSPIPEMDYQLVYGERTVRSVTNATYHDGVEFLALAEQIPIRSDVSIYTLGAANQALLDLKYSRLNGEAVLVIQQRGDMV